MFQQFRLTMKSVLLTVAVSACNKDLSGPAENVATLPQTRPVNLLASTGMVAPIAGLRYYNGTYDGTPDSPNGGTIGFSGGTLYRDNEDYGVTSGCNGEGCGSHPGVDIPIPSGTAVHAAFEGVIIEAGCRTDGWGGLVIIRVTQPSIYVTDRYVYFSYTHLRQINVTQWQVVNTNDIIGYSGGASTDYCHGNSTGAHLHFQIDKDPAFTGGGHTLPWFPSQIARSVNTADSDFRVTQYTYNPLSYVYGGYLWTFGQDGFTEYWTSPTASLSVSGNALVVDGASDPYVWRNGNVGCGLTRPCSAKIASEAALFNKVGLDFAFPFCYNMPAKLYFTTKDSPNWDETKSREFTPLGNGQQHVYMWDHPSWIGIITGLRVDPSVNCQVGPDPIYIGYITIERSDH